MGLLLRGEYHVFGATVVSSLFQTNEVMYVRNLISSYYRTPTPIGCPTKEMHIPPISKGFLNTLPGTNILTDVRSYLDESPMLTVATIQPYNI